MGINYPTRMFSKSKETDKIVTGWEKIANPATLPTNTAWACSLCEFKNTLYLAVAHLNIPFITTYYWEREAWIKNSQSCYSAVW